MQRNQKAGKPENRKTRKISRNPQFAICITFHACCCFTLIAFICFSSALGQSNVGKITGKIVDKKKELPLAGQKVILHIHQGEQMQQRETVTDNSGAYVFDQLSTVPGVHYMVLATYEGKEYVEKDLVVSDWVPELKMNIEIGAFTDDPSKVKVRQHSIVITPPPASHASDGAVSIMEILQIENTSDSAFQTSLNGQPAGLYLNLPKGSEDLQLDEIFKGNFVADTGRLVSNQPLAPGPSSGGYSYVMHIGSGLDISRALTFDTEQLYVFVAEGMPFTPQSPILGAGRQERIHDMQYTIYATNAANPLSAGQTAELRFKVAAGGAAPTGPGGGAQNPAMLALIAIVAACAGGFLVAAIFKIRSPASQNSEPQTAQAAPDASWLRKLDASDLERAKSARLELISRLDDMYEKKDIPERVYHRLRKEQADRLAALLNRVNQ